MSKISKIKYGLLIDYEYCTGCHTCEVACKQENEFPVGEGGIRVLEVIQQLPSKKIYVTYIPFPTELCNLCVERVKTGKLPACVKHCMANCMTFGTIDKLAEKLKEKPRQVLWAPK